MAHTSPVQFANPNVPIHAQLQYQSIQNQQPYYHYRPQLRMPQPATAPAPGQVGFDGRMLRKAMARKTVDYNSSVVNYLENLGFCHGQTELLEPDILFTPDLVPPQAMMDQPCNCVMTKFIRPATNKNRCPIFSVCWTPDGRRLLTGASSGEFTLWNGLTFNFETILQAHDASIRCMRWSHNEQWLLTCDQTGHVKYWQSNMNNVKMINAHKDAVRQLSYSPNDLKFATCSDDGTVRIFDFYRCEEEAVLKGHGSDVKCVDWHPFRSLLVSGSKDSQQPVIAWDPRSHRKIGAIHAHKNTCMDLKWNRIRTLLLSSRDHLCKLFDVRNLSTELRVFRGHKREACTLAWHPIHETLFASGGSDGSLYFWDALLDDCLAGMDDAHDGLVWDLSWHPLGHMLVSGSNDHTTRFWTRNRPGDTLIMKREERPLAGLEEAEKLESGAGGSGDNDKCYDEEDENIKTASTQFNLPISIDSPDIPDFNPDLPLIVQLNVDRKKDEEVVDLRRVFFDTVEMFKDFGLPQFSDTHFEDDTMISKLHVYPNQFAKPIPKTFERAWKSGRCRPGTVVDSDIFTGPTGTVAEAVVDAQALLSDWQQAATSNESSANFAEYFQQGNSLLGNDPGAVGAAAAVEALRDFPFGTGVEPDLSRRFPTRRPPLLPSPPIPRKHDHSYGQYQPNHRAMQNHGTHEDMYFQPPPNVIHRNQFNFYNAGNMRNDQMPPPPLPRQGLLPLPPDLQPRYMEQRLEEPWPVQQRRMGRPLIEDPPPVPPKRPAVKRRRQY
ncbi:hypothetical protein ACOME3_002765 [Neoechinorhynchus agilis]